MTMMDTTTAAQESVSRGVAFLDENVPGWESKIILDEFNIASACKCVCGFVFADQIKPGDGYCDGFDYAERTYGAYNCEPYWPEEMGFDYSPGNSTYQDLQDESTKVLTDRQNVS